MRANLAKLSWREGLHPDVADGVVKGSQVTGLLNAYQRAPGLLAAVGEAAVLGVPVGPPVWSLNCRDSVGSSVWIYQTSDGKVGITDGTLHYDQTPVGWVVPAAGVAAPWTGCLINETPVVNSIGSIPAWWSLVVGPVAFAAQVNSLPGWPTDWRCQAMRQYRYHLVALGVTQGGVSIPDQINWSDRAPPGTIPAEWVASATNEAGDASVSQGAGVLVDGFPLRDRFLLYKSGGTVYAMDYVGGVQVMQLSPIFNDVTIWGRNCVAEVGTGHVVFGDGDIIYHDGHTRDSIVNGRLRREIFSKMDPTNGPLTAFAFADQVNDEAWICIPQAGDYWPTLAYVWNRNTNSWGSRSLPWGAAAMAAGTVQLNAPGQNWNADTQIWNADFSRWNDVAGTRSALSRQASAPLAAGGVGAFVQLEVGNVQLDGSPCISSVTVRALRLLPGNRSVVRRVFPRVAGPAGTLFRVRVGGQDAPADPLIWGPWVPWTLGADDGIGAPVMVSARYISVQFEDDPDQGVPIGGWLADGLDVEFVEGSRW